LHSHLFKAPLSGNQEVSCFGDGGNGDTGDDWIVECDAGTHWIRGQPVGLRHADTGKLLSTSKAVTFNQQNCGGGCPIMGQTEVSASYYSDTKTKWATSQGVYFQSKDSKFASNDDEDL
jgi:dolichyl-phosphate-mannose--protein O-mannosyl transferase